jgi:division protein CdvB (Snf7/Vps24/ESCRT-III family)
MQSLSEEEKKQVLGSVLADQLSAIQESVKMVPEIKLKLDQIEAGLKNVADDIKVVKAAVTDLSNQVNDQDRRLLRLETASHN